MTDNDVIKALDCCCNHTDCRACPKLKEKSGCVQRAIREGLKLINRLKAENESLKKRQKPTAASGYKVENGKVVFFTNMLGEYRREYESLDEIVETLNELLHEAYSKDEILFYYNCAKMDLKNAKSEARKEFADKIKATFPDINDPRCTDDDIFTLDSIDNLLKEMEKENET